MGALLSMSISQFGPPDNAGLLQRYFWIPLLIIVLAGILVLYRLLFPNLQKVKVEDTPETRIAEKKSLPEETIKDEGSTKSLESVSDSNTLDQASKEISLKFLEADERKVVEVLLEAKGSILQKEISWKTGFSRVKTHRVLARLIRRGVVTAEKYYNTNKITLADSLFDKNKKAT